MYYNAFNGGIENKSRSSSAGFIVCIYTVFPKQYIWIHQHKDFIEAPWKSAWLEIKGLHIQALTEALCCVLSFA